MNKKLLALIVVMIMCFSMLAGCGNESMLEGNAKQEEVGTEITVVTTFAGNDGYSQEYRKACSEWVANTNNSIVDMSTQSDETFKTRIISDFETGSEPDVLFFFYGADASDFIAAKKVVSLSEIREEYPDFAINLDESRIPTSVVDDEIYAIPVNGYWEALYVNKGVLAQAGVEIPDENTSWDEFIKVCEKIKAAGFVPIAAALGNIPHYWWESVIFNHTTPANHMMIPVVIDDNLGSAWIEGIEDIKDMFDRGFFPANTTSASDDETFQMFINGEAAFLLDGSWKLGSIVAECQTNVNDPSTLDEEKLSNFGVTFVPGSKTRKATDMIGGMSMGYYITRKAWENPEKRAATVSFVSYMTSDEVVLPFIQHTMSALKEVEVSGTEGYNSLQIEAIEMTSKATSVTGAVQDIFEGDCRVSTFDNLPDILTGKVTARDAVEKGIRIYNRQHY